MEWSQTGGWAQCSCWIQSWAPTGRSWLEEGKHAPIFWCPADTPGFNASINAVLCNICLNVFMFAWMSISYVFSIIYMERKKKLLFFQNQRNLFLPYWFILMQVVALLFYLKWLLKNLWAIAFNVKLQIVYQCEIFCFNSTKNQLNLNCAWHLLLL